MKNIMTLKEFGTVMLVVFMTGLILYPLLQVVDLGTTAYISGEM